MKDVPGVRGLDHVAIAVQDLEQATRLWSLLLGVEPEMEDVASEGVRVALYPTRGARVELVSPLEEDSPISRFLAERGDGIHHICFLVEDAGKAWDTLTDQGARLLGNGPHEGSEGARIFFVHPRSAGGVLVEFREPAS